MNLLKQIKAWLGPSPPKRQPRVITMWEHNGWGDSIFWTDFDQRRVSGWLRERPAVGDVLRAKMTSGRIYRFTVKTVELMEDPRDMFFATVVDLGYEDE